MVAGSLDAQEARVAAVRGPIARRLDRHQVVGPLYHQQREVQPPQARPEVPAELDQVIAYLRGL